MRRISEYNRFIRQDIDSICREYIVGSYTINDDEIIDVNGHVDLSNRGLTKLPLKFGKVTYNFDCSYNNLTSLYGCPMETGQFFDCSGNQLTSLEYGPVKIGGIFNCRDNRLVDVKGFPTIKIQRGCTILLEGNPVEEIFNLFEYVKWKDLPEYLNEYDVIRDGNKVILQALELVYDELGLEVPENIEIKGYEIV